MKGCVLREKMGLLSLLAAIALVCCGEDSGAWPVTAPPEGCRDVTIAAFRDAAAGENAWYRISGELVSVTDEEAGSFYLADDTGYVLVYQMDGFGSYGFTPGDSISIFARKGSHLGRAEARNALYAGHARAPYGGYRSPVAGASWLELPSMKRKDGRVFLHHASKDGGRNYSICYDLRHHIPIWEAYVLCRGNRGAGKRTDAYALDPLLGREEQAMLASRSYSPGNGSSYIRGHMVPSADRLDMRDNLDAFLCSNIVPQDKSLNEGSWEDLERVIREKWMPAADSLYVVTGADIRGSGTHVLDNDGKKVTVPVYLYKAVLLYSKDGGYRGIAFRFRNGPDDAAADLKDLAISVDKLEKALGLDLFANLPDNLELAVESADPVADKFWW